MADNTSGTQYHEIEEAQRRVEDLQKSYLKRFGWEYTCNNPGSYWLWKRDFSDVDARRKAWDDAANEKLEKRGQPFQRFASKPYGLVMADMSLAIQMTLSELEEQNDD